MLTRSAPQNNGWMNPHPHGMWIHIGELEELNAIVPVPHGKPCERRKCYLEFFVYAGRVYHDTTDSRPTDATTGKRHDIPWTAIVQPVRLVPLAELLEEKR